MNRQNILIILIIATGSTLGGLAYGVTNGAIIVGDLTVTDLCIGCDKSETDYTTYNLVLNETITGTVGWNGNHINLSNDRSLIGVDQGKYIYEINSGGTVQYATQNSEMEQGKILGDGISSSSSSGKYKVATFNNGTLSVFKNDVLLQHLTITKFSSNGGTIAISPDGKYIAFQGDDTSSIIDRIQIWQGS